MRAKDIMTTPAVCVRTTTPLAEVAGLLSWHGFTAVPVVDADKVLVGLVSEADVIRDRFGLRRHAAGPATSAGEVMTSPVEFVRPDTSLSALAKCMITGHRRTMPVVEGQRVVGVVTRRDLVATLSRSDDCIAKEVRHRLELVEGGQQWLTRVDGGVVHLRGSDPAREGEVVSAAESVPGVIRVTVSGPAHAAG